MRPTWPHRNPFILAPVASFEPSWKHCKHTDCSTGSPVPPRAEEIELCIGELRGHSLQSQEGQPQSSSLKLGQKCIFRVALVSLVPLISCFCLSLLYCWEISPYFKVEFFWLQLWFTGSLSARLESSSRVSSPRAIAYAVWWRYVCTFSSVSWICWASYPAPCQKAWAVF